MRSQQEIDGVACLIDSTVQILPLAPDPDVCLVHSPTPANLALGAPERLSKTGNNLIAQPCAVEWSTKIPRSAIISSKCRRLNG